ncbi:hypothetical protein P175DRAFT_0419544, partial [Aspergillus ochraceoroseus IBT 24754]
MRFLSLSFMLAFAVSVLALTITEPNNNDQVDLSQPYTVKWTTVGSDPNNFTLVLVNSVGHNIQKTIAEMVQSSKSEYTIDKVWGIPVANGYQFNFLSAQKENTGILAQSSQFNVTKVGEAPKSHTATATATATHTASTSTPTSAASKVLT